MLLYSCYPCAGYLSDDGSPRQRGQGDLSVFKDAVKDCLDKGPKLNEKAPKSNQSKNRNDDTLEKYSGLRIRLLLYIMLNCRSNTQFCCLSSY